MKINLLDLVNNSNFKQYYFITDAKYFKLGETIPVTITLHGKLEGYKGYFEYIFDNYKTSGKWKYYDVGECTSLTKPISARDLAYNIEQSKLFNFDKLEIDFENQIAYIHLTRRK